MNQTQVYNIALEEAKEVSRRAWDAYQTAIITRKRAQHHEAKALNAYLVVKQAEYKVATRNAAVRAAADLSETA
jgi:hypothetical protein